jgi:pantoate--beta-alanine ligase
MQVLKTVVAVRTALAGAPSIGLVPTMGALHEGHLSLIRRARAECEHVVVSIFVNPTQFGENEDFDHYPRDLSRDCQLAAEAGADMIFAPTVVEMYPEPRLTTVQVTQLTERLCGATRPGHFTGVATVVSKLLHIVQPQRAYFGRKDAQQVAVIMQMVRELHMPIEIVPCPIVREADGLALSSRNVYLTEEERKQAPILYQALRQVEQRHFTASTILNKFVEQTIKTQTLANIEYIETLAYPTLTPVEQLQGETIIVAVAVRFGTTRLIDNVLLHNKGLTSCISR